MVKAVKPISVGLPVFYSCPKVEYPAHRIKASAEIGIGEMMLHLYSLVVDSHMVKVTPCLVCVDNE